VFFDHNYVLTPLTLLVSGFEQEGIRRRSYFNVFDNEYQDIAYLAVLDTEWLTKGDAIARGSPWNELLYRHDKERQTILLWEGRTGDSDDTETLRHFPLEAGSECGESVAGAATRSQSLVNPRGLPLGHPLLVSMSAGEFI